MTKQIEFFSAVEGLADVVPIVKATEVLPQWVKKCRQDYKENKPPLHLAKCPGIFDLYKYAYVVRQWCDVDIETRGDQFRWSTQEHMKHLPRIDHPMPGIPIVNNHSYDRIAKHMPRRPESIANIIKIDTPWSVVAPKGVKFLILPFPYPDTFEFEACPGILDPEISTEINIQMYWNVKDKIYNLKAGTPMQILIPLTEKTYKHVVRDANENDKTWLRKKNYFAHYKMNLDRNLAKTFYDNFWNKRKKWKIF
jgi:hypothetical protein|tara:strand:+ start:290 stop:1045 length:756 start_codon:yes stop_codon:yes gene_type:complete